MRFRMPDRVRSWKGSLLGLAFVASLAAFFNPPDSAVTSPDIEYVQRVVDGDTLLFGTGERVRLIGVSIHRKPNTQTNLWRSSAPKQLQRFSEQSESVLA